MRDRPHESILSCILFPAINAAPSSRNIATETKGPVNGVTTAPGATAVASMDEP